MSVVEEGASDGLIDKLPNLKIEIENDLNQRMETDDDDSSSVEKGATVSSETEEGEVVDDDDRLGIRNGGNTNSALSLTSQIVPSGRSILKYDTKEYVELQQQTSTVKNPNGAFVTGVNIFSPEEQAKLDKRAQRFGIEASEAKVLTEKLLKKLYKSMCVKPSDENIRTEALHMRGIEQMTTQDVFTYFKDYGPASLEWITDNSCNVVWLDDVSAARALLGLSVHISGQTSPPPGPDSAQHKLLSSDGDSDVEMETQLAPAGEQAEDIDNLSEESDAVPVTDLGIDLPPGRWRRGAPYALSPCILLRFATTSDRSLPRPGFAKFGSHQFGGYVGLISESRKRRLLNALPQPILFDDVGDENLPKPCLDETDNANPWGRLAKTWSHFDKVRKPRPPSPIIERILPLPPRMTPPPSPPTFSSRPKLVARRRPRASAAVKVRRASDDSSDSEWCSRSKLPRMRMHADDEEKKLEKKLKRARRHRSLSYSPSRPEDLRRRLGVGQAHQSDSEESSPVPEPVVQEPEEDDEMPDLRVAVAAERSSSPEDTKTGIRQTLFQSGNVKSVLRGARGHSENEDEEENNDESEDEENARSSRRHRSRSKERRRHHRRHKKESSHHKSRRRNSDSDSNERTGKTVRSAIKRISPEKEQQRSESREKRTRDRRSPRHEERRRKREETHWRSESSRKSDRNRRHDESRTSRDLRAKISHKHKAYDSNNEFRSKSPLQIEIDNDEYYRTVESD